MFKRLFVTLAVTAFAVVGLSSNAAQGAPTPANAKQCGASDRRDVDVNRKTDTVTVRGDTSTLGNNFYCYTNIPVLAGDTVTFDFIGAWGGGSPRVYLQFDGGVVPDSGENTFNTGTYTPNAAGTGGTATYTIMKDGTVTGFAEIHDRDNGQTTYSNLVIAGTQINF